jgi:DNA repair exonuclease SbcCD ATPase subunit
VRRLALLLVALTTLLAAGCGVLGSIETGNEPWIRADGPRPAGDSESLLMYFEYVRNLPAAELAKEHETVRELYTKLRSGFNRVRYAMLLSVPGTAFNDGARALDVLEPLLMNQDAALHPIAFAVSAQIQEQRREQAQQQKLDELKQKSDELKQKSNELKQKSEGLKQKSEGLQQKSEEFQQKSEELQQKIEALKSLDKSLIERDPGGAVKRR